MKAQVKNWKQFQHYKDRSPPWIKLHRGLLDNMDYHLLSGESAKALPLLWLICSETDGIVPESEVLAFRLRVSIASAQSIVQELLLREFLVPEHAEQSATPAQPEEKWPSRHIPDKIKVAVFQRDGGKCVWCSSVENIEYDHVTPISKGGSCQLANIQLLCRSCNRKKRTRDAAQAEQLATSILSSRSLETEVETEVQEQKEKHVPQAARFAEFWSAYPIKRGKKTARDKWKAKRLDAVADKLIADVRKRIASDEQWLRGFAPHASTYLHQERWEDELAGRNTDAKPQPPKPSSHAIVKPTPTSLTPEQCEANQARLKSLLGGLSECQ